MEGTIQNGVVTAKAAGTATITVTTANGKTASCEVIITKKEEENPEKPVESITLNQTTLELKEQETATLLASIQPADATNKSVTWSSSNPEVATVEAAEGIMQSGVVTAKATGTATIIVTTTNGKTASCEVIVTAKEIIPEKELGDVVKESWQYIPAKYVYNRGIMTGKGFDSEGKVVFAPNEKLTREQFAQVLYSMEGKEEIIYINQFSDVKEGQWYTSAILWAAQKGIVSGYGSGKFGVGDSITREQLAAMLYKYAEYKQYDISGRASFEKFSDGKEISSWAVNQMQWAVANGVMSGKGEKLDPRGNATRAECAAMLRTFLTKFEAE